MEDIKKIPYTEALELIKKYLLTFKPEEIAEMGAHFAMDLKSFYTFDSLTEEQKIHLMNNTHEVVNKINKFINKEKGWFQ